jgi:hypothetical protein
MRATRQAAAAVAPRAGPAIAGLVHLRARVPKSVQADERLLQTAKTLAAESRAARAEHDEHADRLAKGFDEAQKQVGVNCFNLCQTRCLKVDSWYSCFWIDLALYWC